MRYNLRSIFFNFALRDYAAIEVEGFQEGLVLLRSVCQSVDDVCHRAGVKDIMSDQEVCSLLVSSLDAFEDEQPSPTAEGWWGTDWAHHDRHFSFFVREGDFFAYRTGSQLWFGWRPVGAGEGRGRSGWKFFVGHQDGFRHGSSLAVSLANAGFRYWSKDGGWDYWDAILGESAPEVPVCDFMSGGKSAGRRPAEPLPQVAEEVIGDLSSNSLEEPVDYVDITKFLE